MKFTEAQGVEVTEPGEMKKSLGKEIEVVDKNKWSFNNLYKRLVYDRLKGSREKITMVTLLVMLLSEIPIYFFTLLDVLKLESLFKYRLHYIQEHVQHLGIRNYPPLDLIIKTMKDAEFNFFFAYWIPAAVMLKIGAKLGIYVYDTDVNTEAEPKKITWGRFFKELAMISVLADLGFYGVHRYLHRPEMYLGWHKKHHDFKYSIAFAHHWMTYKEACLFILPQAMPPLVLWAITGKRMHVTSMWGGVFFTQLNAILGHAGWRMPFIPRWFPFFQADFHDYHHVDYSSNFGANFPFIDKFFGTYLHPGLETDMAKVMANVKK